MNEGVPSIMSSTTSLVDAISANKEMQQELVAAKQRIAQLEELAATRGQEIEDLTMAAGKASMSIQAFHGQQQQLFDDFVLLRSRYDDTKGVLQTTLWTHCAAHHPDLEYIPPETEPVEDDEQLGTYYLDEMLGEGQFATVRACRHMEEEEGVADGRWAIKIINKERIGTMSSLKRVSNEVRILKKMRSQYIVSIADVLQTKKKLYIVTERGGADLFEFFDEHPQGVPEEWAKEIMVRILLAVSYCHAMGVCHRDLKPENILMIFNTQSGTVEDLKLCDFGLSTSFKQGKLLTEFCGSPGFFAPEMIIHGAYNGDKSDLWSIGCIMLELIMGHEQFCEVWMSSYDYDTLQDKAKFSDEIDVAVRSLSEALECTEMSMDFILKFLKLRSSERPSCSSMISHPWLGDIGTILQAKDLQEIAKSNSNEHSKDQQNQAPVSSSNTYTSISSGKDSPPHRGAHTPEKHVRSRPTSAPRPHSAKGISLIIPVPMSPTPLDRQMVSISPSTPSAYSQQHEIHDEHTDAGVLRIATLSVEPRARSVYEQHEQNASAGGTSSKSSFHLPPIDPPTPKVASARKMLNKEAADSTLLTAVVDEMSVYPRPSTGDTATISTGTVASDVTTESAAGSSGNRQNSGTSLVSQITFHKGNRRSRDGLDPEPKDLPQWTKAPEPLGKMTRGGPDDLRDSSGTSDYGSVRGSGTTDHEAISRSSSKCSSTNESSTVSSDCSPRDKSITKGGEETSGNDTTAHVPVLKTSPRSPRGGVPASASRMSEVGRALATSQSVGNLPSQPFQK